MKSFLKKGIRTLAATAMVGAIAAPLAVQAQSNYPDRPIKMIVAYSQAAPQTSWHA